MKELNPYVVNYLIETICRCGNKIVLDGKALITDWAAMEKCPKCGRENYYSMRHTYYETEKSA